MVCCRPRPCWLAAAWSAFAPASGAGIAISRRAPPPVKPSRQLSADNPGKSRCCCRRARSTTTTTTSASPRSATCRSITAASTVEADKVIYDQTTKRLHAEGNVRLTEADGKITYAEIMDLSDDYRDGFVDSLRLDSPDQTRMAAARADRTSGNFTVFHSGVYTACEPARTIRKSRRCGRSRPRASSTTRARR